MASTPYSIETDPNYAFLRGGTSPLGDLAVPDLEPEPADPTAAFLKELLAVRARGGEVAAPEAASAQPGLFQRGLDVFSTVAGAQKHVVDLGARKLAETAGWQPEATTTGGMAREAVGLASTPDQGYLGALAGKGLEFGVDLATDPLTWETGALGKVVSRGAAAAKALEAGSLTPELAVLAERALARGRTLEPLSRGIGAAFTGQMGVGAAQGAKQVYQDVHQHGWSPRAAEETLGTALGAGFAGAGALHMAAGSRYRNALLERGIQKQVEDGNMDPARGQELLANDAARNAPSGPVGGQGGGEAGAVAPEPQPGPGGPGGAPGAAEATTAPGPSYSPDPRVNGVAGALAARGLEIPQVQRLVEAMSSDPTVVEQVEARLRGEEAAAAPAAPAPQQLEAPAPPAAVSARPPAAPPAKAATRADRAAELRAQNIPPRMINTLLEQEFGKSTPPIAPAESVAPASPPAAEAAPPTPAPTAAEVFKSTDPLVDAALKLRDEGKKLTEETLKTIPGVSRSNKETGNSAKALRKKLVTLGHAQKTAKGNGYEWAPEKPAEVPQEAVRVPGPHPFDIPDDETFRQVVRAHIHTLLGELEGADKETTDRLVRRIAAYTQALSEPGRLGEAAPVLQAIARGATPNAARPEPTPTSGLPSSGAAGYRELVSDAVPPEPGLPMESTRPYTEPPAPETAITTTAAAQKQASLLPAITRPVITREPGERMTRDRIPNTVARQPTNPTVYVERPAESTNVGPSVVEPGVSPALYGGGRGHGYGTLAEKPTGFDKQGRPVIKGEVMPSRPPTPEEAAKLGEAIGGAGYSLERIAKKELETLGGKAARTVIDWKRKTLSGDELDGFNARVRQATQADEAARKEGKAGHNLEQLYSALKPEWIKARPDALMLELGAPGARIPSSFEPGSPGKDIATPKRRFTTKRMGISGEDQEQQGIRNVIRMYVDGDPNIRRIVDEGHTAELRKLLGTAASREPRKGTFKNAEGERVTRPPTGEEAPSVGTQGRAGKPLVPADQGFEVEQAAFPEVHDAAWGMNERGTKLDSYDLPGEAIRRLRTWHMQRDGFAKEGGKLTPEGRTQLSAAMRNLETQAKEAHAAGDVIEVNNALAKLANLVSVYHGQWTSYEASRVPWKSATEWARRVISERGGTPPKGRFEEAARQVTGLVGGTWRTLRSAVHLEEKLTNAGLTLERAQAEVARMVEAGRKTSVGPSKGEEPSAPNPEASWQTWRGPVRAENFGEGGADPELARALFEQGRKGPSEPPFVQGQTPSPAAETPQEAARAPHRATGAEREALRAKFEAGEAAAVPVEGHPGLTIADHDQAGIHPTELAAVQAFGEKASPPLEKLHSLVQKLWKNTQYQFLGYTTSPIRMGSFFKGARNNPLFHVGDALRYAEVMHLDPTHPEVAQYAAREAGAIAAHEGLHSVLPHGGPVDEVVFSRALADFLKTAVQNPEWQAAERELAASITPDVVKTFQEAMPAFREKVAEANRGREQETVPARVSEGSNPREIGAGDQGSVEGGAGRGVRPERAVPAGSPTPGAGGEGRSAPGGRSPAEEPNPRGAAGQPGADGTAREIARAFPQEAQRVGTTQAVANAAGTAVGAPTPRDSGPEALRKLKMIMANGPLSVHDPKVLALQDAILFEAGKPPSPADAVAAQSRPGHGARPLQAGEFDIAFNLPKHVRAGSDQVKAMFARAMDSVDPSLKKQPLRVKHVDDVAMKMLSTNDPDEVMGKIYRSGIRDAYAMAVAKKYWSMAAQAFDARGREWVEAVQTGDQVGAEKALFARNVEVMRMALGGAGGTLTSNARALAMAGLEKLVSTPLSPQESFAGKFVGALRKHGLTVDEAQGVYDAFMESSRTGDTTRFSAEFNAALGPKDFRGRLRQALTIWKANMMGIPTQFANIAGNASFKLFLRDAEILASAALDRVAAGVTGRERQRFVSEYGVAWTARRYAMKEAMANLRQDMGNMLALRPDTAEQLIRRNPGYEPVDVRELEDTTHGKPWHFAVQPLKMLSAMDSFFQTLNRNEYLFRQAYRQARGQGHTGHAAYGEMFKNVAMLERAHADPMGYHDRANRVLADTDWIKKGLLYAAQESQRDVFQAPYKRDALGAAGTSLENFAKAHPLIDLVIPFKKTPINVAKEALLRTPLGFYMVREAVKRGDISPEHAIDEYAKPMLGTMLMGGAVSAALNGYITGQGPTDPYQQQTKKETGWQPYSLRIGDAYIPYNRFEPLASVLGMGADFAEAMKRGDTTTAKEKLESALGSIQQNLTNKTFLQGLESFFGFWHDPMNAGQQWIKQLGMSAVPNTLGIIPVGTLARAIDPNYRQSTIFSAPATKIPFASQILPQQYTTLGDPRKREGSPLSRLIFPIQITHEKHTPAAAVAAEIDRIGMKVQRPKTYARLPGGRYEYEKEDQSLLAGAQQQAVQTLANLIRSPGYLGLPDNEDDPRAALEVDTKEDVIRQVLMKYRRPVLGAVNSRANQALASRALSQLRGMQ